MSRTDLSQGSAGKKASYKTGKRCLQIGGIGSVLALICCFTPLLVITLGTIGLGMMVQYLDFILLPTLLICLGAVAYGLRLRKTAGDADKSKGGLSK